jgi:hypothetical protein
MNYSAASDGEFGPGKINSEVEAKPRRFRKGLLLGSYFY